VEEKKPVHVVVLGAGFGGLTSARTFAHPNARITVVDRRIIICFNRCCTKWRRAIVWPEIAQPIRAILSERTTLPCCFTRRWISSSRRNRSSLKRRTDYGLSRAGNGRQTDTSATRSGNNLRPAEKHWMTRSAIRSQNFVAFEAGGNETDPAARDKLLPLSWSAAWPTGGNSPGAFAELTRTVLNRDFRQH